MIAGSFANALGGTGILKEVEDESDHGGYPFVSETQYGGFIHPEVVPWYTTGYAE